MLAVRLRPGVVSGHPTSNATNASEEKKCINLMIHEINQWSLAIYMGID